MPELLKSKKVTARKVHSCATCYAPAIQPGQVYQRDTYLNDGRVYDWVMCAECNALERRVFEWVSYIDEGIGADNYEDWAREYESSDPDALAYIIRRGMTPANHEIERQER